MTEGIARWSARFADPELEAQFRREAEPVRPDDRANPRPVDTRTVVQASGSGNLNDDGIAWGDVAAGALGGFGIALLIGLGGFALIHSHRRTGTIAH